jgi:small subunit ribosomal protein S17
MANQKSMDGRVVSAKMEKTVIVQVDHTTRHRLYRKIIKRSKRYFAHDDRLESKVGDLVRITEMRPMSKLKRWRVSEIIERGEVAEVQAREIDSAYLAIHREREAPPAPKSATDGDTEASVEEIEAAEAVATTEVLEEEAVTGAEEEQTEER